MDDDSAELVLVLFYDEKDESAQAKLNAISKKISQSSSNHITLLQEKGMPVMLIINSYNVSE